MTKQLSLPVDPERLVRERFELAGLRVADVERKDYPDETILVIRVPPGDLEAAANLGNTIDQELHSFGFDGFVVVRTTSDATTTRAGKLEGGVADPRAFELVNLLTARSRTSEIQPSLSYIRDSAQNVLRAVTPRHHLIFGRRGAGKTALMVEAKRTVEEQRHLTVWINLQTHRKQSAVSAYMWVSKKILEVLATAYKGSERAPAVLATIANLSAAIDNRLAGNEAELEVGHLIPQVQSVVKRFLESTAGRLYIFLDDLHYLERDQQPAHSRWHFLPGEASC